MKYINLIILFTLSFQLSAQKNNTISLNMGMMKFSQSVYPLTFFTIRGLNYERVIKNYRLGISYNRWVKENDNIIPLGYEATVKSKDYYYGNFKATEKKIVGRKNYFMIDLNLLRKINFLKKYGELYLGTAISYAQGSNTYVDSVIESPTPPFDNIDITYYNNIGKYAGIVPIINYNYYLWKDRIVIGVHGRVRKYFGLKDIQFDSGLHLGFNF